MLYPMMTERQVAIRWKISLKTLRYWRHVDKGPVWHKPFRHVRYHEGDILEFECKSAQHWMTILGDGERVPRAVTHPPKTVVEYQSLDATEFEVQYVSAKDVVEATSLPAHIFTDPIERARKRIPHLLLVGNLRFSLEAILQWERANSVRGCAQKPEPQPIPVEIEHQPAAPACVPRWYEIARGQDNERFDSTH